MHNGFNRTWRSETVVKDVLGREVSVARDFLEGWVASLNTEPVMQAKVARLIEYAMTDA